MEDLAGEADAVLGRAGSFKESALQFLYLLFRKLLKEGPHQSHQVSYPATMCFIGIEPEDQPVRLWMYHICSIFGTRYSKLLHLYTSPLWFTVSTTHFAPLTSYTTLIDPTLTALFPFRGPTSGLPASGSSWSEAIRETTRSYRTG